jgi:hypothetical protein
MPKRVIDFDAMWGSDKLAACAEWAQAEYAWLYGLADASGCFELTNLRVIWGRVAAIRKNLTIERLEQVFDEFQDKGLLFVWEHEGKRYGHWTGSDVPGRLPPPSWRMRLERFAPAVPKQRLAEYMSKYARGRAALAGVGFRDPAWFAAHGESSGRADTVVTGQSESTAGRQAGSSGSELSRGTGGLKEGLEAAQAQDLNWNLNWNQRKEAGLEESGKALARAKDTNPQLQIPNTDPSRLNSNSTASNKLSEKELAVQRELRVGQGPVCGPARVRPEVLERIRLREAARAGSRSS